MKDDTEIIGTPVHGYHTHTWFVCHFPALPLVVSSAPSCGRSLETDFPFGRRQTGQWLLSLPPGAIWGKTPAPWETAELPWAHHPAGCDDHSPCKHERVKRVRKQWQTQVLITGRWVCTHLQLMLFQAALCASVTSLILLVSSEEYSRKRWLDSSVKAVTVTWSRPRVWKTSCKTNSAVTPDQWG